MILIWVMGILTVVVILQSRKIQSLKEDLDPDALIPVKINGKEELVSLNELRADKAGKVEWDKRFTQLDKERKEFKSKTGQISEKITNIFKETDPEFTNTPSIYNFNVVPL